MRPTSTFVFYIHDRRYSEPTLSIVEAVSEAAARAVAVEALLQSPHRIAIDVCENDRLKFSVTVANQRRPDEDPSGP